MDYMSHVFTLKSGTEIIKCENITAEWISVSISISISVSGTTMKLQAQNIILFLT